MNHFTFRKEIVALLASIAILLTGCAPASEIAEENTFACGISKETWASIKNFLPKTVGGGEWDTNHCQGIAIDDKLEYMYFSFTTKLVKVSVSTGEIVGTVDGWSGHLGDLAYYNGKVYGSLEYYYPIGSFYAAVFDCDEIIGETAHGDCMKTMYLSEVNHDYTHQLGKNWSIEEDPASEGHAYGCSGIDGITFGAVPGDDSGKIVMMVNYGIYKNTSRQDNDYQVMLQYDPDAFLTEDGRVREDCGDILDQINYHTKGPKHSMKYFIYTGNTNYGVQNLEFDTCSGNYVMAVYKGMKERFPNYSVYYVDGSAAAEWETLKLGDRQSLYKNLIGSDGEHSMEAGFVLRLAEIGTKHEDTGVWGSDQTGADMDTGLEHLYGDYFYITEAESSSNELETAAAHLYRYDRTGDKWFKVGSLRERLSSFLGK